MNELIAQLPEYDPHPNLWARIEADLDGDATLARTVGDLPQHEPKADLWAGIAEAITESEQPESKGTEKRVVSSPFFVSRTLWAGFAAAAMVVLIGTWVFLRSGTDEKIRVEYAVEQSNATPDATEISQQSAADERAEAFIARQCAEQQLACQRPEVHELRTQLMDLSREQKRIDRERLTFGDDPTLVRAQVKIENQRAEITKELITLLRS